MPYVSKLLTKFGFVLQSFCRHQNPDQDQDKDFTTNFNIRIHKRHLQNFFRIRKLHKKLCSRM